MEIFKSALVYLYFFFSGHKFRIKKYLLSVKNSILFFTIVIEKVFQFKKLILRKKPNISNPCRHLICVKRSNFQKIFSFT